MQCSRCSFCDFAMFFSFSLSQRHLRSQEILRDRAEQCSLFNYLEFYRKQFIQFVIFYGGFIYFKRESNPRRRSSWSRRSPRAGRVGCSSVGRVARAGRVELVTERGRAVAGPSARRAELSLSPLRLSLGWYCSADRRTERTHARPTKHRWNKITKDFEAPTPMWRHDRGYGKSNCPYLSPEIWFSP